MEATTSRTQQRIDTSYKYEHELHDNAHELQTLRTEVQKAKSEICYVRQQNEHAQYHVEADEDVRHLVYDEWMDDLKKLKGEDSWSQR